MQTAAWMHLFRHIPAQQQSILVLVTTTGMEIMVHSIIRLEMEFVVLRGRLSGSTEAGRIYFMPYDQISNLAINQLLKETEVHALFGDQPQEKVGAARPAAPVAQEQPAPEQHPLEPEAVASGQPEPASPLKPAAVPPPSKSVLLERVRARLKDAHREP